VRAKYVILFLAVTALYICAGYAVLWPLPSRLSSFNDFSSIADPAVQARLFVDSQASIRTGAVSLLAGSVLGIAGIVAVLTFAAARRDATGVLRKSQDDLFTKALEFIAKSEIPSAVGAISLLTDLSNARPDLHDAVMTTLFVSARRPLRLSGPIVDDLSGRSIAELSDREPVAAAALRAIASIPLATARVRRGEILRRRLDKCDLRRFGIDGGRFELINFAGSYLWDTRFVDCAFIKCVFLHADWSGAQLADVEFVGCDLSLTNLGDADGSNVTARECALDPATANLNWLSLG
jgi:hypothetical protein